jgi:uncharacterized protein
MELLTELLELLADFIVFEMLGVPATDKIAQATHYFIKAFVGISILLVIITYAMGFMNSYLPMEKIRDYLSKGRNSKWGNVLASFFGAITPFCSCSSIPLFVGMVQANIPIGVSLSFLITSPLVNELAIVFLWLSFGWKVSLMYVISGISLGIIGGMLLEKMDMENHVADWLKGIRAKTIISAVEDKRSFAERFPQVNGQVVQTLKKLWPYIFGGLAIGSFIHGYIPESFFEMFVDKANVFAVPLAVLLSIPLYIDTVGILPLMDTLVAKGVSLGTALVFMMGAIGLSIPEGLLLKKVMKTRLIIAFFSSVASGIVLTGFIFNLIF